MPSTVSRAVAISAAACLLILSAPGAGAWAAKSTKKVNATSTLKSLVSQTTRLPKSAASRSAKAKLLRRARHARSVASANPCLAVKDLSAYRRTLRGSNPRSSVKGRKLTARLRRNLTDLGPASLRASRKLLTDKRTAKCGGGIVASNLKSTKTSVVASDENGMRLRVQLPALRFVATDGGGKSWTKLVLPDTDSPGTPGTPGIPVASSIFAVPDGATLQVKTTATESYTLDGVAVLPVQPQTVDQAPGLAPKPNFFAGPFSDAGFKQDRATYAKDAFFPALPAFGKALGQARDLNIAQLGIPAAQVNPKTGKLKVLTQVDVDVTFAGGPKTFSDAVGSPWEIAQNRIARGLLNANVIAKIERPIVYQPCGEELLVITNPSTLSAANTYATARRAAGFLTRVVQTGGSAGQIGSTAVQIQAYIRSQVNHPFCIRPSYVTIIGDDELVPTFTTGPSGIPSDNPYSTKNDTDELPDVAVGRIIANTLAQVDAAIAKIIHYETAPPTGPMLTKAIVAAQFQDTDDVGEVNDGQEDRTFIQFAEKVRNGLTARGVAVDRIYEDNPATDPQRFNDGTSLPASLKKPTFAWDGDGADVSAAWNQGRFMVVHRDHGWSDGWGDPFFTTTEVDALTNSNDNLPVVLSINCASAQYDTDETSFVQNALVKPTGGAVGVFGDTRNSPSWSNSQLALGFVDALLPTVLSGEGPATKQRMGDALIHGKLRLAGLAPPSGPGIVGGNGDTRNELYLWHYFGDPTMQMFGGGRPPLSISAAAFTAVYKPKPVTPGDPPPFEVNVTLPGGLAGQPISLLRNGQVIGKALAGDGSVTIASTFTEASAPLPGELVVALGDADDVAPVLVAVTGVPAPAPADLVVGELTPSTITVRNQGATAAGPFKATITDSQQQSLTFRFPGLAAGATSTQSYNCADLLRQRTASVDTDAQVSESDESNNATPVGIYACSGTGTATTAAG